MATNEIFAPNGPNNKMTLPVSGTVESGDPVKVGQIVGVAQTNKNATDLDANGISNTNAAGNVTVWNAGVWRLPVNTKTTAPVIGGTVYATVSGTDSKVALASASSTGAFPFGVFYEAATAADETKNLAVRVFEFAGPAEA